MLGIFFGAFAFVALISTGIVLSGVYIFTKSTAMERWQPGVIFSVLLAIGVPLLWGRINVWTYQQPPKVGFALGPMEFLTQFACVVTIPVALWFFSKRWKAKDSLK